MFALTLPSGAMLKMTAPTEKMSSIVRMSITTLLNVMTAPLLLRVLVYATATSTAQEMIFKLKSKGL